MPELPEVETTLRGIMPHIHHQTITDVNVQEYRLRWPVPDNIKQILLGKTVQQVARRGKYLLLTVEQGTVLIHLGMSGRLRILMQPTPPQKHDHIDVIFVNRKILRFTDPRRFGTFLWLTGDVKQHSLLKNLGVEPLTTNFSGSYLYRQSRNRSVPIKSFLMDNKIVTGIGNIYANEALFMSGIHPAVPAKLLSLAHYCQLVKSSKQILRQAIARGGTTLKDFTNSEGKPGYFSQQLKVYGREGKPCVICHTILEMIRIGQRSTVYCKNCQVFIS